MPTKPPPKRTLLAIPAPAKLSLLSLNFDNIDVPEATSKISNSLELVVNELSAITILVMWSKIVGFYSKILDEI